MQSDNEKHNPAMNALKHGLAAKTLVMPQENAAELHKIFAAWLAEYGNPAEDSVLYRFAEKVAQSDYRRERFDRYYDQCLHSISEDLGVWMPGDKLRFDLALRYKTAHERAFQRDYRMLDSHYKAKVAKEERDARYQQMQAEKKQRAEAAKAKEEEPKQRANGYDLSIPVPDMYYVLNLRYRRPSIHGRQTLHPRPARLGPAKNHARRIRPPRPPKLVQNHARTQTPRPPPTCPQGASRLTRRLPSPADIRNRAVSVSEHDWAPFLSPELRPRMTRLLFCHNANGSSPTHKDHLLCLSE